MSYSFIPRIVALPELNVWGAKLVLNLETHFGRLKDKLKRIRLATVTKSSRWALALHSQKQVLENTMEIVANEQQQYYFYIF